MIILAFNFHPRGQCQYRQATDPNVWDSCNKTSTFITFDIQGRYSTPGGGGGYSTQRVLTETDKRKQ